MCPTKADAFHTGLRYSTEIADLNAVSSECQVKTMQILFEFKRKPPQITLKTHDDTPDVRSGNERVGNGKQRMGRTDENGDAKRYMPSVRRPRDVAGQVAAPD